MTENAPRPDWQKLAAAMVLSRVDERADEIKVLINRRKKAHRQRQIVWGIVMGVFICTLGTFFIVQHNWKSIHQQRMEKAALSPIAPMAPIVEPLTTVTRFVLKETDAKRTYRVANGIVRFETRDGDTKQLVVKVANLTIEDIGTIFVVETLPHARARIGVRKGRVRISWPGGAQFLNAEETGEFPPATVASRKNDSVQSDASCSNKSAAAEDWRALARSGHYKQAFLILKKDPSKLQNRVGDLLLAADVMRLSGSPDQAVQYLQTVTTMHANDPRSTLATFTLGRIFLDELGRPVEAARAFASMGRDISPLAEKALAREVEAWSRAGEMEKAKGAALRYLHRYPNGDRVDVVRAFGGLDAPQ